MKSGSTSLENEIQIYLGNYINITKCEVKINAHICLMLTVYESFHQTVKYGQQRNHILQDLIGLEI